MAKLTTICPVCENDISIASRDIKPKDAFVGLSDARLGELYD